MAIEARPETQRPADTVQVLALVEDTLRELRPVGLLPVVTLESVLDRDLGFDSLGRMELLLRAERAFRVSLAEDALQGIDTVADLQHAIERSAAAARGPAIAAAHLPLQLEAAAPQEVPALPATATTLPQVLAGHARTEPGRVHIVYLHGESEHRITYAQLEIRALAVAASLQGAGIAPGQCVAIMLPTCPEYFSTYFGVLLAGAVPVPIYPPARPSQLEDHVLRHTAILANAQAVALVTVAQARTVARLLQVRVPGLRHVLDAAQLGSRPSAPKPVQTDAQDTAFIQYTSGSTGSPKGVVLTHANILANIRAMAQAVQATPKDVFVSWLPLYHDMGLIGAWLGSLYVGCPLVLMSPLAFLARPARWLEAIGQWRGTLSAGPNFAYELCLKHISDDELARLDLSSWRLAFNGAEAVSADTVTRFADRFSRCGLRAETMAPVYGLAEASVGVAFPPLGRPPPIDAVQREPFTRDHRALPAAADEPRALRFVGCGRALPGHAIRIVDEQGQQVGERVEGRLEFRGPSATTRGYFRDARRSADLYRDGWLDSGDRAYVADGELYVTGRVKDIVIRAGRHLHPEEIEEAVGRVEGVRKGCVAVFGSPDKATGTERLVVLAELQPHRVTGAVAREAIDRAVFATIGEPADEIVLAAPHTVLKTSSGKVRRSACRALYEAGRLAAAGRSARWQLLGLAASSVITRITHAARELGRKALGGWAMGLFCAMAPVAWLLTLAMRSPQAAWSLNHVAARVFLALGGIRLPVSGMEQLPPGPCVLVSNHASYLDGLLILAALPRAVSFTAKRELESQFFAGRFLRRLGTQFVERLDTVRAVQDARRLSDALARGRSLFVFAEGTFVRQPGLRPFHLGGFVAAAQERVPVVPIALTGQRAVLPDGTWWPRPAPVAVHICRPLFPTTDTEDPLAIAVDLRDRAYRSISAHAAGE